MRLECRTYGPFSICCMRASFFNANYEKKYVCVQKVIRSYDPKYCGCDVEFVPVVQDYIR